MVLLRRARLGGGAGDAKMAAQEVARAKDQRNAQIAPSSRPFGAVWHDPWARSRHRTVGPRPGGLTTLRADRKEANRRRSRGRKEADRERWREEKMGKRKKRKEGKRKRFFGFENPILYPFSDFRNKVFVFTKIDSCFRYLVITA